MMPDDDYISLKWGTLKAWNITSDEGVSLLREYFDHGANTSAILHRNTPAQKEVLCKLIDAVPGDIHLDWDDKLVSKDEAKKYVLEYGVEEVTE